MRQQAYECEGSELIVPFQRVFLNSVRSLFHIDEDRHATSCHLLLLIVAIPTKVTRFFAQSQAGSQTFTR